MPILVDVLCSKRFRLGGTVYEHIFQTLQSAVGSLGVGADEVEKIAAAVEALFKTKDDKFENIMKLIFNLAPVEATKKRSNFADLDSQTKFLSKVGASFKEYISQTGSLEETKEKPAYLAALTSILKLGFELGQDDTLKLVGLLEKDGKTHPDLLYVLETALHQLKGKDGTANDPAKWMDFLNDAKLDATGRLAAAILVNVKLTTEQRVEFIKDKVKTWDKSGQGRILMSVFELAEVDGFPASGINPKESGLLKCCLDFIHRGLDSDGNDDPPRYGTKLLLALQKHEDLLDDATKSGLAALLKSQIKYSGDSEVQESLVEIYIKYKWSSIILPDIANFLGDVPYKVEIIAALIPLYEADPSEPEAQSLANYLAQSMEFNDPIIHNAVETLLFLARSTPVVATLLEYLSHCVQSSAPPLPDKWIQTILDFMEKRVLPTNRGEEVKIIENMATLLFHLEVNYGLDQESWTRWKALIEKSGEIPRAARYANLTQLAISDRVTTPEEEIDVNDYTKSWPAQLARFDPIGVQLLVQNMGTNKGFKVATKLQIVCIAADMAASPQPEKEALKSAKEEPSPLDTQGALYFHAISLLAESDHDLTSVDQLVEIKHKLETHQVTAFDNIAKMLAKTYVLTRKWDEATAIFKTVITNQDSTVYDHLELLKSIKTGDLKAVDKIQDLVTLTKLQINIAQFCSRVGLDLFSEPVSDLVTFIQTFEPKAINASEIDTSDPWTWPTKLLRGFILSKITEDDTTHQKDTILQQFDPLWSTWTRLVTPPRFNTTHLSEDTQICENIRQTLQTMVGTTWDLGTVNFVTFLLSQIRPIPDFTAKPLPLTFPQVKTNWLKNTPPNEAITDESATTFFAKAKDESDPEDVAFAFFAKAKETGFLNGIVKNLNALYTLTSCGAKAEDLIPFMDQLKGLELTSKLDELSIAIPTVKEQSGDFSLAKLTNYLQNGFLGRKASTIFEKNRTQKSIVADMLKSVNQFGSQETVDFASLQTILAIMQKRLDQSGKDEALKKQLMTYATLIQAMYTYSLEIKTVLEVVQDDKMEVDKWFPALSVAPKSEDVKERGIDELMKLLEDSKSEGLDLPEIRKLYDSIIAKEAEWKDKKEDEVKSWAKKVNKDTDKGEVIAGLVQSVALTKKDTKPRNAQILALLTLTQSYEKGNGRLARVETGEGKSLIIALFAAYVKLTQDLKVDIVTPSSILAARDSHLFADFYTLLSLDSGFLTTIPTDKSYEKDVLYGDPQSLQSDCLRVDFHFEDDLRKKRPFSLVIVDEVDSMLIDQAANTTKLVEPVPGVEFLAPLFAAIWRFVNQMGNVLIPINNVKYFPEEVTQTDCSHLVSVLSRITKKHGPPTILNESIENFAARMADHEKNDPKARECLKKLIRKKYIPGDIGIDDDPTTDEQLNKIIQERWNTELKTSLVYICGKFLGRKIQIYRFDKETGIPRVVLSPIYHPAQEPKDIPDQFKLLPIFESDGNLVQLLEASGDKAGSFLFNRITEQIKAVDVFSDDKNVDRDSQKVILPQHFKPLYNFKLQRWITSAIAARTYIHENRDYVLKVLDGDKHTRIVPVDSQNTGILEESSVWPDGVHQFLQIKHLLATTPEQITTNFLSNVSYFKRYGKNVFGLTGTLGSDKEKELLSKTYQVGTVNVPTFQAKRHTLLKNMTLETSDEWIEAVVTSVVTNVRLQRAVLLICKTIEEADHFKKEIETTARDTGEQFDIQKYTRLDQTEETKVPENQLKGGSIVIATMLAGRGTDFQIDDKLSKNGGLHVILTFFPGNVRVEEQATGRAARKGQPGSSQLIVLAENHDIDRVSADWISKGHGILTEFRDKVEESTLKHVQKNLLPMITREDGHFQKYCTIRKKLADAGDDFDKKYALLWLDELWGIALDKAKPLEEGDPGQDVLQKEFDDKMASLEKAVDDKGTNYKDDIANPKTNLLLGAENMKKGDNSSPKSA
ncbi:Protein translocase subunit SecA [Folsomia candida]|uniref:Protein translocase subunit SecA n=1 Tax=Folsomia candida TaxID=158441 RepID=A0A226DJC1_FOLCA|nr:Protein translocase subunit SecA [Folsomia candida]